MNVDLNGKSKFPEINAHRERLIAQMKKLEKEGKQNGRKYKRAAMALQKLQVMNYMEPSGTCNYSPKEFSKTASEEATIADAYLAGYCLEKEAGFSPDALYPMIGGVAGAGLGAGASYLLSPEAKDKKTKDLNNKKMLIATLAGAGIGGAAGYGMGSLATDNRRLGWNLRDESNRGNAYKKYSNKLLNLIEELGLGNKQLPRQPRPGFLGGW